LLVLATLTFSTLGLANETLWKALWEHLAKQQYAEAARLIEANAESLDGLHYAPPGEERTIGSFLPEYCLWRSANVPESSIMDYHCDFRAELEEMSNRPDELQTAYLQTLFEKFEK
jgi:hypothetical protein